MKSIMVSVRMPKLLVDELDHNIDGVKIRSRAHGLTVALKEYLDKLAAENRGGRISMLNLKPPKKNDPHKKK